MINRELQPYLIENAKFLPVIALLGPRQSGKTTLSRQAFPQHAYVSLEDFDLRSFAINDPRGFLDKFPNEHGIILDEIQHAPDLLSYIQTRVDLEKKPGFYVIISSQNFLVTEAISQTLAGRVSIHTLLPLSIGELEQAKMLIPDVESTMVKGFYPYVYATSCSSRKWYEDYLKTYIERDVRMIKQIGDLDAFQLFVKLCAGRIGQLLDLTSLGRDCGVSHNTARSWLSILEASYIVFLVRPHFNNLGKRLIKSPKLYFYDTGLAAFLLGIESAQQMLTYYQRGSFFENMIMADLVKTFYNHDRTPRISFWRAKGDKEIDCIIESGGKSYPIEIKATATILPELFENLSYWNDFSSSKPQDSFLIYGSTDNQARSLGNVVAWTNVSSIYEYIYQK